MAGYLGNITKAAGLTAEDAATLGRLVKVFDAKSGGNRENMAFYEDRNPVEWLGIAVPDAMAKKVGARVGWAAKSVDYLASRSIFDGFTAIDETVMDRLNAIMQRNRITAEYAKALPSELVCGCGFWTVSRGGAGEPSAVINYHNAQCAAAVWDYRRKRVKAGFVIEDFRPKSKSSVDEEPCMVVMHTERSVIQLDRVGKNDWTATYMPHAMGRPMMEAMCYRPTDRKMGKSRISAAVKDIVTEAQREIIRMAFSSEVASQPLRYMLGADDAAFDADKFSLAYNTFLLATKDEDGDLPQVGQLQGASPEPHIAIMEHLMNRISGETGIPVSSFGLKNAGYQSADALRASSDDLILECESLNRTNGEALVNVALMALAVDGNKGINDLTDEERSVCIHWCEPSMPSIASQSDAMTKQAGVVSWLPETELFWEKLGYSEEERMRLKADKRRFEGRMTVDDILAMGANENV